MFGNEPVDEDHVHIRDHSVPVAELRFHTPQRIRVNFGTQALYADRLTLDRPDLLTPPQMNLRTFRQRPAPSCGYPQHKITACEIDPPSYSMHL